MRNLFLLCAVLACGCNPITNATPTRSLDRPSDVALICAVKGLNDDPVLAPLSVCDYSADNTDNPNTPATAPNKYLTLSDGRTVAKGQLFALLANTTRGEVALVANGTREFVDKDTNKDLVRQVVPLDPDTQVAANLPASIIDLDNASPGYGFIPVGSNPERIRATEDGCVAVTVNADSCDLALIDVQALLRKLNGQALGASTVLAAVRRIQPRARDVGTVRGSALRARPTWIEFTPDTTGLGTGADNRGNQCTATAAYKAFVAFPGCGLVGEVDLRTGELVDALRLTATGAVRVAPEDVRCPVECTGAGTSDGGTGTAPDLATDDAGGSGAAADGGTAGADMGDGLPPLFPSGAIYPRTLAADGQRLYIGDAARDVITTVDLDPNANFDAATVRQIPLEAAGGVTVVRLSPLIQDPDDPGYPGTKFLYAVARDRTVRVIDAGAQTPHECETNPDGRILNQTYPMFTVSGTTLTFVNETESGPNNGKPRWPNRIQQTLRCLRIGQIPRSPLSRSPGILLPGGTLPRDVTFTRGPKPPDAIGDQTAASANPRLTVGDYAWIIGSSGNMVVVPLFDTCPQPNVPQGATSRRACVYLDPTNKTPDIYLSSVTTARTNNAGQPTPEPIDYLPHRIRTVNGRFERSNDLTNPEDGAARLVQDQLTIGGSPFDIYQTTVPFLCDFGRTTSGEQQNFNQCINTTLSPQRGTVRFYDSAAVRNENWSMEWESILLNPRPSAVLSSTPTSSTLSDVGAGFCSRGVRAGDKVDLIGCSSDADCRPWQQCHRDAAAPLQNPGLCLSRDPQTFVRAQTQCAAWTRAVRRYRIREARSNRVELEEITEPESPLNTRTCNVVGSTDECSNVKVLVRSNSATVSLPTTCLPDAAGVNRCLRACRFGATDTEGLCGPGFVCARSQSGRDMCLRAPLPPANDSLCFTEAQDYQVRVGDAFLVTGEVSQSLEEGQVDPGTGLCTPSTDPGQRSLQARIPLDERLMDCPSDLGADWLAPLSSPPTGNYANVCRLVPPTPCDQNSQCGTGGTCLLENGTCLANTIVRYSNPVFEAVVVVPPRPLLASAGTNVPLTYNRIPAINAQVSFRVTGGYGPLSFLPQSTAGSTPQLLRSIVLGPDRQTLYIVDEGRQNVTTGIRGQLLRFYTNTKAADTSFNVQ